MTSKQIKSKFAELGHDTELSDIENRISVLTGQFKVPIDESETSVVSYFLRHFNVDRADYYTGSGDNQTVTIADIPQEDGEWINLRVKLVDIWDSTSDYIRQTGLVGDATGRTKFIMWANSGLEEMIKDKCYLLENVVTNEYNDKISVTFNKTSAITEIDDTIEVGYTTTEYTGVLVAIKPSSGLIKRCPECKRALKSGTCSEHGNVSGTYDLRIMGILDDGVSTQDILLNKEMTESVWGHTIAHAMKMATEALDAAVVLDDMNAKLVGKYYTVSGSDMGEMLLLNECEAI